MIVSQYNLRIFLKFQEIRAKVRHLGSTSARSNFGFVLVFFKKPSYYIPSITLTLNVTLAVFPEGSVKVYVTGVLPTGKKSLGALDLLTKVAVPELSVAVGSA